MGEQTIESERARAEQGERDKGEKTTVENISSSVWNEAVVKAAQMGALAARSLVCVRVRTRDSATWDSLRFHCLRRPSRAHRFARLEGPACQGEAAAWTEVGLVTARVCRCSPLCRRQRPSVMCAVSVHAGELVCTCHACLRRSPLATVFSTPAALTAFYEINLSRSPLRPLAPSPKRAPSFPPSLPLSASLRAALTLSSLWSCRIISWLRSRIAWISSARLDSGRALPAATVAAGCSIAARPHAEISVSVCGCVRLRCTTGVSYSCAITLNPENFGRQEAVFCSTNITCTTTSPKET